MIFFLLKEKNISKTKKYFDYYNKFMMQDSIKNLLVKEYQNTYSKYKPIY